MNQRITKFLIICSCLLSSVQLFAQTPYFTSADYKKALWMTTRFYGGQRSGANNWLLYNHLPSGVNASLTGLAFSGDNDGGYDLSGGWHDCGDHVKFGQTQFYSAYMLLKGYAEFPTGYGDFYAYDYQGYKTAGDWTYEGSGHAPNGIPDILDEVKHATDFFIKCTKDASTFYYQVGQGNPDHTLWETAVQMQTQSVANGGETRVSYKNPADASMPSFCGATLALMSRLYRPYDAAYADLCLTHAQYAYTYAKAHPGTVGSPDGSFYPANGNWKDDYASMCTELFFATNTTSYKTEALSFTINKSSGADINGNSYGFDYTNNADIAIYNQFLLGSTNAVTVLNSIVTSFYLGNIQSDGQFNGGNTGWGPTRYNANTAFIVALWQKMNGTSATPNKYIYDNIDYLLGKNSSNLSFVVGFGANCAKHPHHRNFYLVDNNPTDAVKVTMPIPAKNAQFGLMVGGTRNPSSYTDQTTNYQQTEGGIDYNACLVGVLAYINSIVAPVAQHPSPNLGADQSLCGVSSIVLKSNIATDGKKTFTWQKNGTTVQAASTTANTYTITAAGTYTCVLDSAGKWSSSDDITITAALPAINLGSSLQLCNPATATLDMGASGTGYTYQWKKNNVVIVGETSQTLLVSSAGTYLGTLSATGCTSTSGSIVVTSALPIAGNDTLCAAGTANLTITGSGGPYQWYSASTAGTLLTTGTSYSPSVTATTTYYVQDGSSVSVTAGPSSTSNPLSSGSNGGSVGFRFTAAKAFTITQMKVLPFVYSCGSTDNVTVTFQLAQGATTLGTYTSTAIPCTGVQSGSPFNTFYTINFATPISVPAAGNYTLTPSGGNALAWFSAGANFTTMDAAGVMDITDDTRDDNASSFPGIFDIKIQAGSSCARTPVYAVVNAAFPNCRNTSKQAQTITFGTLTAKQFGDPTFTLGATASSGLAVTYTSSNPAVATVSSAGVVTIIGIGSTVITASQAGNTTYNAATDVPQTLVVGKANQTITFGALTAKKYGDPTFTLAATASSSLTVTYTSSNPAVATVTSAGVVTIVGVGSTIITASQAGNTNYNAATSVTQTLVVGKADQTTTFGTLTAKSVGDPTFTLTATASSGLTVTYTSSNPAVATVSSAGVVTIVGAGSTVITASQAGNANYNAATDVPQTLVVGKSNQTITFGALTAKKYGDPTFTLAATASSSLTVTYTSSNPAVATVSSAGVVTIVGVGSTIITASQAGNANYNAATDVPQTLVIGKADQTITFGTLTAKSVGDPAFTLSATASSGLAVTYTSSNPAVATVTSAGVVTIVGAGSTVITASQAGNANYNAATDVPQTLVVGKVNQTITFGALTSVQYGDPTFTLAATASSGLAVTYTSSNPAVATVSSSGVVTIVGVGSTVITASQAGNTTYNAATSVTQTLVVGKDDQTITFGAITSKAVGDPTFTLTATASSGLAVTYTSSNPAVATVTSAGVVTIVGAGSTIITASQSGNASYNAATSVTQTLVVTTPTKTNQTITFGTLAAATVGDPSFTLTATASSGLAVTYTSSNPAVATVTSAGVVTIVGAGSTVITASQAGNATYNAASSVTQTLVVNKTTQTITFPTITGTKTYGDPSFSLGATSSSGLAVTYTSSDPTVATVSSTGVVTIVGAGSAVITATQAGNGTYASTSLTQTLVVNKANQTITFAALPSKVIGNPTFTLSATASSGLTVTYTSSNPAVATVSGNVVTIVGAGSTIITASQAGNTNYNAATSVAQTQIVTTPAKTNQTITFGTLSSATVGDPSFTLSATASSGLAVTYTSSNPAVATVTSAGVVTIVGAGSTVITASQAGNATYNAATSVTQTLVVNTPAKTNQIITFGSIPAATVGDPSFTLSATASSGLAVTYTSSNPAVATVTSAGVVTIVGAGSTVITASQAGNTTYNAATSVTQTLVVNTPAKTNQTIIFGSIPAATVGDPTFTLTATASSGLAVTYTSSNPSVATVSSSGVVTIVGAGSTVITANQAGNATYNAATSVTQTLLVSTPAKTNQTITFGTLAAATVGDPSFTLSATASSGLAVTYTSSNPAVATVSSSGVVTIVGAGSTVITANQAGNATYNAAEPVTQTLVVSTAQTSASVQLFDGTTQMANDGAATSIGASAENTQTSAHQFTIKNITNAPLTVTSILAFPSPGFTATTVSPSTISPNGTGTFTVRGIPTDPNGPTSGTIVIQLSDGSSFILNVTAEVGTPTGVAVALASSAIDLFPNPTTGISNLEFNGSFDNVSVTVYTADGSKVFVQSLASVSQSEKSLDIQELPSGVYFVEINTTQGKLVKRLIKQQ